MLFGRTLDRAVRLMRAAGIKLTVYVDDIGIAAETPEEAVESACKALDVLHEAGWSVSAAKCFLRPTRVMRFLGFRVANYDGPMLAPAPSLAARAVDELRLLKGSEAEGAPCPRHALSIWGIVGFAGQAAPALNLARSAADQWAALLIREQVVDDWPAGWSDDERRECVRSAAWLVAELQRATAEGLRRPLGSDLRRRVVVVAPDASGYAVGAVLASGELNLRCKSRLRHDEVDLPSQARELLGVLHALKTWAAVVRGKVVDLRLDATAAVGALGKWASPSATARRILVDIRRMVDELDCELVASSWSRECPLQQEADAESKALPSAASVRTMLTSQQLAKAVAVRAVDVFLEASVGGIAAPEYTSSWPLLTAKELKFSANPPQWCGTTESLWMGPEPLTMFAAPPSSRFSSVVDAFMRAPDRSIMGLVATEMAAMSARQGDLSRLSPFYASRFLLVRRGESLRTMDPATGKEGLVGAQKSWFTYWYVKSDDRVMSSAERLQRLFASGFPPHPGPPKASVMELWGRAERDAVKALSPHALTLARPDGAADVTAPLTMHDVLATIMTDSIEEAVSLMRRLRWEQLEGTLQDQVVMAIAEWDAERGEGSRQRAARTAKSLIAFAAATGAASQPWSDANLDVLALSWARSRLRATGSRDVAGMLRAGSSATANDLSALAESIRTRLPALALRSTAGAGPLSQRWLKARGAGARHEYSVKRHVYGWELRWGLEHNAHVVEEHPAAVACLVAMGQLMWRSMYIRLTTCGEVRPVPGEAACWCVRWPGSHKSRRRVLPGNEKVGFLKAQWVLDIVLPWLARARTCDAGDPLFPTHDGGFPSYNYLVRVLRLLIDGLPDADNATLHGLRVGNDTEQALRNVSPEIRDWQGWWKRVARRMGELYEAVAFEDVKDAADGYGTILADRLMPGLVRSAGPVVGPMGAPGGTAAAAAASVRGAVAAATTTGSGRVDPAWVGWTPAIHLAGEVAHLEVCTVCRRRGRRMARTKCSACGETGHRKGMKACPMRPAGAVLRSVPGDDGSESSGSDDASEQPAVRDGEGRLWTGVGGGVDDATWQAAVLASLPAPVVEGGEISSDDETP